MSHEFSILQLARHCNILSIIMSRYICILVATIPVVIVDMVQASHSVNQMNSMTHLSHAQVSCTYHTSTVLFSGNKKNKRPHVCAKFVIMKGLILRSATS